MQGVVSRAQISAEIAAGPLLQGSTTVSTPAVAMMASIALPPFRIIASRPAKAASRMVVATALRVIGGEQAAKV